MIVAVSWLHGPSHVTTYVIWVPLSAMGIVVFHAYWKINYNVWNKLLVPRSFPHSLLIQVIFCSSCYLQPGSSENYNFFLPLMTHCMLNHHFVLADQKSCYVVEFLRHMLWNRLPMFPNWPRCNWLKKVGCNIAIIVKFQNVPDFTWWSCCWLVASWTFCWFRSRCNPLTCSLNMDSRWILLMKS